MICRKISYDSKKEAITIRRYSNKNRGLKRQVEREYFCKKCKKWHLTSKKKEKEVVFNFKIPEDNKIIKKVIEILDNERTK